MADYLLRIKKPAQNFTMIPNETLCDDRLSSDALGVLCWLLMHPDAYLMRVSNVKKRFKFGKDKWQRIARELRSAGYVESIRVTDESGKIVGHTYEISSVGSVDFSEPKTAIKNHRPENPACGENHRPENPASGPENPAHPAGKPGPLIKQTVASATLPHTKDALATQFVEVKELWERAENAASMGLRWKHPQTGQWHSASEWKSLDE